MLGKLTFKPSAVLKKRVNTQIRFDTKRAKKKGS
jgi:hypothetical protein